MRSLVLVCCSILVPWTCFATDVVVFPGAEGHGVYTVAGRGGRIIIVDNLNSSGPGSFRAAVQDSSGPRTVIFEVSGTIDLLGEVMISNPYITIAGQTAPSPGIALRFNDLKIKTHDVLIQHIRVRPGDYEAFPDYTIDAIQIGKWEEAYGAYNIVIDHCSFSWSIDEILDCRQSRDITVSNCIFSEALRRSIHPKGGHSMGPLVYHSSQNFSFIRNLIAHCASRNPKWGDGSTGIYVNNLVYSMYNPPDIQPTDASCTDAIKLSIEGNYIKEHEFTNAFTPYALIVQNSAATHWVVGSKLYVQNNSCRKCTGEFEDDVVFTVDPDTLPNPVIDSLNADTRQAWPESGVTVFPSGQVLDTLLANAGAFPSDRDAVDSRILQQVQDSSGVVIDCVDSSPKFIDDGDVHSAGQDTAPYVILESALGTYTSTYKNYNIKVTNGSGTQVRVVTAYDPYYDEINDLQRIDVDSSWDTIPDSTYTWEIFQSCTLNAGGWSLLDENYRKLFPPVDDDTLASGYTRLEEWLHTFPKTVLDSTVISNVNAYSDSVEGMGQYFAYQYRFNVTWETDKLASSMVQYRELGDTLWQETPTDSTPKAFHWLWITGLESGTSYECRPVSTLIGYPGQSVIVSTGPSDTVTTTAAVVTISNFDLSQEIVYSPYPHVEVTFSYQTSESTSCKINVRKAQDPPIAWGSNEISVATEHGNSHSHTITSGLYLNTDYNAYIQVFEDASYGGEDTVFPDGSVPGSTPTSIYIEFRTLTKYGIGEDDWRIKIASSLTQAPLENYLASNYPNPFNPATTIKCGVKNPGSWVRLDVYNISGQLVRTLVNESKDAGEFRIVWDGRNDRGQSVAGGIYFLRLKVNQESFVQKMVLLR